MNRNIWPWRRTIQLSVVIVILALPIFARYAHYLSARQLDKMTNTWNRTPPGILITAADKTLRLGIPDGEGGVPSRRPRKAILRRAQDFNGSLWSATFFGVSFTDLLAAAQSAAASGKLRWVLLTGAALPLLATLLLGRVYCGWLCPMGLLSPLAKRLRAVLEFLEIKPFSLSLSRADKYYLLGAGLLFSFAAGLPILQYIYPPAIIGQEAHGAVAAFFDAAEAGNHAVFTKGLTAASLFLLTVLALEVMLLPGFWCKSLCPGGAIYSLLGRFRLLRVRRKAAACTDCKSCDVHCPMGLHPMTDRTGAECDNCGVCIDACPTAALGYAIASSDMRPATDAKRATLRRTKRTALFSALFLLAALPACAHHIMGIPHYSYDKNYPQAPVIKLVENVGEWEVQLTGYPGRPTPGIRTEVHVYAVNQKTHKPYLKPLRLEARKITLWGGTDTIYGPDIGRPDDNLHKFYPTYPDEGNYELILYIDDTKTTSTLRFTLTVGDSGSPWRTVGLFGAVLLLFLVVVRAVRIKRLRRISKNRTPAA